MYTDLFRYSITETTNRILEVEGLKKGEYDAQAVQYDKLINNSLYNKIMWGNSPKDYSDFCKEGLESSTNGVIADIGCGTLGFTFNVYAQYSKKDLYLCDLSYEMLNIGENRIKKICDDLSNITFLRSDALDMPFKNSVVQTVLCFGLFHVFNKPELLIQEIERILKPGGQLFLTSLCTDRKISAKYLNLLHKKGHVSTPLHSTEIREITEKNGIEITNFKVKGGMTYISGTTNSG